MNETLNHLTTTELLDRAWSIAETLDGREEKEAASLIRHLAWRLKGSEE